mmetsp:Transcript_85961/g.165483  ORF Transcript_85961/g.165483 Transcript_85961/m.165483 type:complete len:308 (+) Transcript_85961:104-1027(+)
MPPNLAASNSSSLKLGVVKRPALYLTPFSPCKDQKPSRSGIAFKRCLVSAYDSSLKPKSASNQSRAHLHSSMGTQSCSAAPRVATDGLLSRDDRGASIITLLTNLRLPAEPVLTDATRPASAGPCCDICSEAARRAADILRMTERSAAGRHTYASPTSLKPPRRNTLIHAGWHNFACTTALPFFKVRYLSLPGSKRILLNTFSNVLCAFRKSVGAISDCAWRSAMSTTVSTDTEGWSCRSMGGVASSAFGGTASLAEQSCASLLKWSWQNCWPHASHVNGRKSCRPQTAQRAPTSCSSAMANGNASA